MLFLLLCLTILDMILSRSIHVTTNGIFLDTNELTYKTERDSENKFVIAREKGQLGSWGWSCTHYCI